MILAVWGGGRQRDASDGVRYNLSSAALDCPKDSTLYAQVTGERRLSFKLSGDDNMAEIPSSVTGARLPLDAGRTWLAAYHDVVIEDTILVEANRSGDTQKGVSLMRLHFGATLFRDVRLYGVMDYSVDGLNPGTTASVTVGATTLTDSTAPFGAVDYTGQWVVCEGKKLLITSNTSTVLTGTGGWIDSVPSSGVVYTIQRTQYPKYRFKVYDNAGTLIATGQARNASYGNTTPIVLQFQWVASTTSASNTHTLYVASEAAGGVDSGINGATGGTATDPAAQTVYFEIGASVAGSKGTVGFHGSGYAIGYGWDNLNSDSFPRESGAIPAHGQPSTRLCVGYRQPVAGGTPKSGYDQWTKSTGTDAAALIDESPDTDAADYISETVLDEKQAIPMEALANMSVPAGSNDTFYAVESVAETLGGAAGQINKVYHVNASADDAGRTIPGGGTHGLVYCAILDPAGAAFDFAKVEAIQTAFQVTVDTVEHRVAAAGQLILFERGAVAAATRRVFVC